jgi:hypothetical protein
MHQLQFGALDYSQKVVWLHPETLLIPDFEEVIDVSDPPVRTPVLSPKRCHCEPAKEFYLEAPEQQLMASSLSLRAKTDSSAESRQIAE